MFFLSVPLFAQIHLSRKVFDNNCHLTVVVFFLPVSLFAQIHLSRRVFDNNCPLAVAVFSYMYPFSPRSTSQDEFLPIIATELWSCLIEIWTLQNCTRPHENAIMPEKIDFPEPLFKKLKGRFWCRQHGQPLDSGQPLNSGHGWAPQGRSCFVLAE